MLLKRINRERFGLNFTVLLSYLIFYQSAFVLPVGGSLKLYDILLFLYIVISLYSNSFIIANHKNIGLLIALVVSPGFGAIITGINQPFIPYYKTFPSAMESFRFNPIIAPALGIFYSFSCFFLVNYITLNKEIFLNIHKIIRGFVLSGTIVSIYSIYAMVLVGNLDFPDIVPDILDNRNSQPEDYPLRTIGFSNEPGQFAFLISWVVIYLIFVKDLFQTKKQSLLLIINFIALVFTMSSSLVGFIFSIILGKLLFERKAKAFKFLIITLSSLAVVILTLKSSSYWSLAKYYFYEKIENYINPELSGIDDSGVKRAFTERLGLEIFKGNPVFGVGSGNSYFYMHQYIDKINFYSNVLDYSVGPQNSYSMLLAEAGALGFIGFLFFFISIMRQGFIRLRRNSNENEFLKASIIGTIVTLFFFISISPYYNLYLWFNIALLSNYLNFQHRNGYINN